MIHIRIELWPLGDKTRSRLLGTIDIANDGTGTRELGNYFVKTANALGQVWRTGHVNGWPRMKYKMALHELVYLCLKAAVGERAEKIAREFEVKT